MKNKLINRDGQDAAKIFDNRTLEKDYRTLSPMLRKGMSILDVGCGTGAITKDIAHVIGRSGKIVGIDNTEKFILSGREKYCRQSNLELRHVDLFDFNTDEKFDLIISARTLQWLSKVNEALAKMKDMLKPAGKISILDYNHTKIEWSPSPPDSMKKFYTIFLNWRSDAGMNNQMADFLPDLLAESGFHDIEKINSDEHYRRGGDHFAENLGIWSKVAGSKQMVEEGYLDDALRLQVIAEYNLWVQEAAISMTLKLNEVRGSLHG